MNMSKTEVMRLTLKKRLVITAVSVVTVAGGIFAGYHINRIRRDSSTTADVYPVSMLSMGYFADDMSMEGTVTSGSVQRVQQDESQLIDKILVKKGDTVKKGDPILQYDTTLIKLDLDEKKNDLALAEDSINQTQKEIDRLYKVKPIEDMPDTPQPTLPPPPEPPTVNTVDTVNDTASKNQGSGSKQDPFVFLCNSGTMVTAEFMNYLMQITGTAEFDVYIDNEPSYKWVVYGAQLTAETAVQWCVSDGVEFDGGGQFTIDMASKHAGKFGTLPPDTTIDDLYEEYYDSINNIPEPEIYKNYEDDYTYSKAELAKMIAEKQNELTGLELDKKRADVEYRKAQARGENGTLYSTIDGVVAMVNDGTSSEEEISDISAETDMAIDADMAADDGMGYDAGDSNYLIVIRGQGALGVTGTVGEYDLDKVKPGDTITVMSYETGTQAEATVTDVDSTPADSYYSYGNPNVSGYNFRADITGSTDGFTQDSMVSISVSQQASADSLYIPVHYIREDEGGSFVLKAGKDELLEKQYVETGSVYYGTAIEIKSGITNEDMICFPYGKNIKEGIHYKENDEPPTYEGV